LQFDQLFGRDNDVGKMPEAGVDSVDRFRGRDEFVEQVAGGFDRCDGLGRVFDPQGLSQDRVPCMRLPTAPPV